MVQRLLLLVFASSSLCWAACGSSGSDDTEDNPSANEDAGLDEPDTGPDAGPFSDIVQLQDTHNFSFVGSLHIPTVVTAAASDLDICWDELTADIQCHDIDPLLDIDNIALVRFRNLSETEIETRLSQGDMAQSYVDGYINYVTDHSSACVKLSELSLMGTTVDITEEYAQSDERTYLLLLATGTVPGVGSRMLTFLEPSSQSTNTEVQVEQGCDVLEFSADLTSLDPVVIARDGPWEVDFSQLTVNGQGNEMILSNVDGVMLGFYEGYTPAQLEQEVLDLELIATSLWRLQLDGSSGSKVDLTNLSNEAGPFDGFSGEGTWLLALRCSTCQNPAPLFLSVLVPE